MPYTTVARRPARGGRPALGSAKPALSARQSPKLVDGGAVWYGRPVRGCRAPIAATVFSIVVSIASSLGAAEPTTNGGFGVVVFAVDTRSRDTQAMVDAVRAHLTGLPVRLVIETESGGTPAGNGSDASNGGSRILGTLTIDPGTPGEWVVSFTEPAIDTTLVRRIRIKPQGKAVALEEAAIVVRSMVEAMLDGGHVGIARPARPAGEDTSRPPAGPRGPRRGIAITGGYIGTSFAPGLGWQSGAQFGVRWQARELYAGLAYAIFGPIDAAAAGISLQLSRHPGSLVLGYEGDTRLAPIIEVQLTVDYVQRRTLLAEGYDKREDEGRWTLGVGGEVGLSWSVLPRFRLHAQGGADWMINSYAYVSQPYRTIVPASPVRPKVMVGLALDLW